MVECPPAGWKFFEKIAKNGKAWFCQKCFTRAKKWVFHRIFAPKKRGTAEFYTVSTEFSTTDGKSNCVKQWEKESARNAAFPFRLWKGRGVGLPFLKVFSPEISSGVFATKRNRKRPPHWAVFSFLVETRGARFFQPYAAEKERLCLKHKISRFSLTPFNFKPQAHPHHKKKAPGWVPFSYGGDEGCSSVSPLAKQTVVTPRVKTSDFAINKAATTSHKGSHTPRQKQKNHPTRGWFSAFGGDEGARTLDLTDVNRAL